jgi:uncharacterized integral membrane protein (TIGR00697 family)
MAASVTVLLCSNFIGAAKQTTIDLPLLGATTFSAGVLFFPISYIFGDILTEVYGYGRDRRVVWAGFGALAFASFMAWVVVSLPPAGSEFMKTYQANLEGVFGNSWRIALGSMIAFWCGSFSNAYVLAKMKVWMRGQHLWTRTIGSTLVGELVDSGGRRLIPLNRAITTTERGQFDRVVLGKSPDEMARYWIDRKIRGQSGAPKAVEPVDVYERVVAKLDGAIGYVHVNDVRDDVKVVRIDGKAPTDHGYPIRY